MYAIRRKDGLYRAIIKNGVGERHASADLFKELIWYRHYLQATEACSGSHDIAVDAKVVAEEALEIKDERIKQLLQEVMDLQKKLDPALCDYRLENFDHRHSLDSMDGNITPEHSDEEI